jgi:hypothetical protein
MAILLADLVLLLHILFVIFAVAGGFLVLWRRWILWLHLPAVAWAAIVEFYGLICPLTPIENWLRLQGGGIAYQEGFIARYIWPILYPEALTREVQTGLGWLVLVLNLAIYSWVWRRWRRERSLH